MDVHYKDVEKYCEECGSRLLLRSTLDIERKRFCSRVCQGRWQGRVNMRDPEIKARFVAAGQTPEANEKKRHVGINHPMWKGGLIQKHCNWCGSEFYVGRYRDAEGNGKYCSRDCFERWQASGVKRTGLKDPHRIECRTCGEVFFVQKCLANTAKYCSVKCHNVGNLLFSHKYRNTSIERKICAIADELGLEYTQHKQIGRMTVPDMFVEPNVAIYADGDYWHSLPENVARDTRINKALPDMGYTVIRFSETTINEHPEEVEACFKGLVEMQKAG